MTPITFTILNFKKQNKERLSPPFHVSPQIVFISRSVQCKWDSIFLDNNDLSLVVVVGQWCPSSTRRRWTTSTSSGVTRPSLSAWFRPSWPTLSRWRPGSRTTARPTCRNTRAMVIFFSPLSANFLASAVGLMYFSPIFRDFVFLLLILGVAVLLQ